MKLTCEACEASFSVPDSAIKPEGRKVKCSKCGHVWLAKPEPVAPKVEVAPDPVVDETAELGEAEDAALKAISDMLSESEKPKKKAKKKVSAAAKPLDRMLKRAIAACVVGIVIASLFAFKSTFYPVLSPLYKAMGMVTTEQVVIQKLAYEKREADKKDYFAVSGEIVNMAEETMAIPTLRVSLQDELREVFYSKEYEVEKQLEPGEAYPFNASRLETPFKGKAKFIIVEIGNEYELSARD